MDKNKIVAITLLIIVSFISIFGEAIIIKNTKTFLITAVKVQGKITGISTGHDSGSDSRYFFPIISFKDEKGELVNFSPRRSTKSYSVGDTVSVLYDPANPLNAEINSSDQIWQEATIVPLLLCFLLYMIYLIYSYKRINNQ